MKTVTIELYTIDELSAEAKKIAIEANWGINTEHGTQWHDFVREEIFEMFKAAGFEPEKLLFTGFGSQGDGAMVEYSGLSDTLRLEYIESDNLTRLEKYVARKYSEMSGSGKHSNSRYYHENTCEHSIEWNCTIGNQVHTNVINFVEYLGTSFEKYIKAKYRELCQKAYNMLETNYYALNSDESIIETLRANEYYFEKDGTSTVLDSKYQ